MENEEYIAFVLTPEGGEGGAVPRILEESVLLKSQITRILTVPYGRLIWALFKVWIAAKMHFWRITNYALVIVINKGRLRMEHDKLNWLERKIFASGSESIPKVLVLTGCNTEGDEGWWEREKEAFRPYGLADMRQVIPACTTDAASLPPLGLSIYGQRIEETRKTIPTLVNNTFKKLRFRYLLWAAMTTKVHSSRSKYFFPLYCAILTCSFVSSCLGVGFIIKWFSA